MDALWLLLIPYTGLAFGLHGGEFISGINRQARNALCAIPFGLVAYITFDYPEAVLAFAFAYIGANLGFDWFPASGWKYYGGLAVKGLITLPPFGAALLPLAYYIGDRTRWKNVFSEYFSGTLYGITLAAIMLLRG